MNKKLLVMAIVPVLVVMSGSLAFSAWAGSGNAFFGETAATVGYTETLSFIGTNATMNPVQVGASSASMAPYTASSPTTLISTSSGGAGSVVNVYVNVTNLVPGTYVGFQVVLENTGSAVLNTSELMLAGGEAFNGLGQQLNSPVPIAEGLQPPVSMSYVSQVTANGISNIPDGTGPLFLANATTTASSPAYLAHGDSITYDVFAILPSVAATSLAGYHFAIEISIPITVDP